MRGSSTRIWKRADKHQPEWITNLRHARNLWERTLTRDYGRGAEICPTTRYSGVHLSRSGRERRYVLRRYLGIESLAAV